MNIANRLFNIIFSSGQKTLYPYEIACLYGFLEIIPANAKPIFEAQMKHYGRVQRSKNGKHLAFFDNDSDDLCKSWPENRLFTFRSKPSSIAELNLLLPGSKGIVKAEIFMFAGRIAGIEFLQSPTKFQGTESVDLPVSDLGQWNQYKSIVSEIKLLQNPMLKAAELAIR